MIKAENITKSFKTSHGRLDVLKGVSFSVEKGEFVMLLGKSGGGKSTLLNILGLMDTPTDGTYLFDGQDVGSLGAKEKTKIRGGRIGFVFQGYNLINTMTAYENVELPLGYQGVDKKTRQELVSEALERVGLSERAAHLPVDMSGGEQQRVAIARAMVRRPQLILADEPTGNLDRDTTEEIMSLLKGLGCTVFMVTHNEDLFSYADRSLRLAQGLLV